MNRNRLPELVSGERSESEKQENKAGTVVTALVLLRLPALRLLGLLDLRPPHGRALVVPTEEHRPLDA